MEQDIRYETDPIPRSAPSYGAGAPPEVSETQLETPETPPYLTVKRTGYFLPIAYVILGSLSGPLLFVSLVVWILNLLITQDPHFLMSVIIIVLVVLSVALLIGNIVRSFRMHGENDINYCVNSMLIVKYGMLPFFILQTFFSPLAVFLLMYVSLELVRFTIIYLIVTPLLFMLPGAFYGIQVVRFSLREKKINPFTAILHGTAQFIPVLDVLDAAYLSAVKWKTARKMTLAGLLVVFLFLVLYLIRYPDFYWILKEVYGFVKSVLEESALSR